MKSFFQKNLRSEETLASYLSELLLKREMTMVALAKALHVQEKHVQALVGGEVPALPDYYVRHLLRRMTELLAGNVAYAEQLYARTAPLVVHSGAAVIKAAPDRREFTVWSRWLTVGGLVSVFLMFAGYLGLQAFWALQPPRLQVSTPTPDMVVKGRVVTVSGETEPEATVAVNGQQVVSDTAGSFTMQLFLDPGVSVIEVTAAKKYSRERAEYRRVVVESEQAATGVSLER